MSVYHKRSTRTRRDDRRLGRHVEFDTRSLAFPLADVLEREGVLDKVLRSYTWANGPSFDQNPFGPVCVAGSEEQEWTARPKVHPSHPSAEVLALYHLAQSMDPWADRPHDGSTVLAGAKAARQAGWLAGYVWAFSLEVILLQLSYRGGVIMGTNWYEGMFNPDADGRIRPTGSVVGGHAYRLDQIDVKRERVWIDQTWGEDWGIGGRAWLSFDDLDRLRKEHGEALVPLPR